MFKRDKNIDVVKKAQAKVLDSKRDSFNRMKHLRSFLDHVENLEAKEFFQNNHSIIYFIFHDAFSIVENNIRSKGVHKSQREEFEQIRYLLEKILTLLPELIAEGWQAHSIRVIMKKLLHHGNSCKTINEAMKLFIIWYQILRENAATEVDFMFANLIPNFTTFPLRRSRALSNDVSNERKDNTFYTTIENEVGPVIAGEHGLLFPNLLGETQPEDVTSELFENLLQAMVSQLTKIQWARQVVGGVRQYERSFAFLLEKFREFYLQHVFPNMSTNYSLYRPNLDLPAAVRTDSVLLTKHQSLLAQMILQYVVPTKDEREASATRSAQRMESNLNVFAARIAWNTLLDDDFLRNLPIATSTDFLNVINRAVVRNVLFATQSNVDFVHEIFRQTFVSPLGQTQTTKKVIAVYREWILMSPPDPPSFLIEVPSSEQPRNPVFCGQQNLYKVFITNASNFFLLSLPLTEEKLLEEQVDLCKRVMNIYRFMVMKKLMERSTWEQLLYVILHVTSQVLSNDVQRKSGESLGQQLAPALFQTLIVTWIKANLHATICVDLWNGFVRVLSKLAYWEPLVEEWAKTMKTLTRILTTRVYGLDLDNLPLDRLSDQQVKRRRALKNGIRSSVDGKRPYLNPEDESRQPRNDLESKGGKAVPDSGVYATPVILRRNLSDSHLNLHHTIETRNLMGHRSRTYPDLPSLSCPLHQRDSMNTSPTASSGALENSSIKDHQLNQMIDCASSENADRSSQNDQQTQILRTNSNASDCGTITHSTVKFDISNEFHSSPRIMRDSRSVDDTPREPDECLTKASSAETTENDCTDNTTNSHLKQQSKSFENSTSVDDRETDDEDDGETHDPDGRSVLAGGTQKGWCKEVAVVLWRRMICSLGDVNNISDPVIHVKVLEQIAELCATLMKVRDNQRSSDELADSPPQFIPPIHLLVPWFFEATMLSEEYEPGKLIAYQLLCDLSFRNNDIPLNAEYITRLYDVLHRGLTGKSQRVKNCIVKASGTAYLGTMLPGFTLLMKDYVRASADVLQEPTLKKMPRTEAVLTLGAHLFLRDIYGSLQTLDPTYNEGHRLIPLSDLEETVLRILIEAARSDPDWQARCTALSTLCVHCYKQLNDRRYHSFFREMIAVFLQSLKPISRTAHAKGVKFSKCNQYTVCQIAAECLSTLAEYTSHLTENLPEIPEIIMKTLAGVLKDIYPKKNYNQDVVEGYSSLVISLIFCLSEWTMRMPLEYLTRGEPSSLNCTLDVLESIIKGVRSTVDIDTGALLEKLKMNPTESAISRDASDADPKKNHTPLTTSFSEPSNGPESRNPTEQKSTNAIRVTAKAILSHLLNNIGHFPMNSVSLTNPSSLTIENDDVPGLSDLPEISRQTFSAPNIQIFTLNDSSIVSLVEIPANDKSTDLTSGKARTRVIVRDICGKFSWECLTLYGPLGCRAGSFPPGPSPDPCLFYKGQAKAEMNEPQRLGDNPPDEGGFDQWPSINGEKPTRDNLDKLIRYIGETSPECATQQPLNSAPRALNQQSSLAEAEQIREILAIAELENAAVPKLRWESDQRPRLLMPPSDNSEHSGLDSASKSPQTAPFQYSRLLLNQLNFLGWEHRSTLALLQRSDKLLRELRYLDQQRSRETHKIAVIYVGPGQEDKNSILMNKHGSLEFENFVNNLGWDVDLKNHAGYRGGLDPNGSTGETAPYFANSSIEVLFHVSTRIPATEKESMTKKLRHLGNDEVHVVWSEHQHEYRRGIIATEFGDVFIVLYPLPDGLCRIQINAKPDVPFFGPLFDGAIVSQEILPALVRATAINADRAVNSLKLMFRNYYEVRSSLIENICRDFREPTTFEEFACKVFAPSSPNATSKTIPQAPQKGVDCPDISYPYGEPRTPSRSGSTSFVQDSPSSPVSTTTKPHKQGAPQTILPQTSAIRHDQATN